MATDDKAVSAAKVRTAARALLGRDSESLSERNFTRILHDAHDADIVDLRRRGSDYEVAPAIAASPVDKQLEAAATANAPAPAPAVPAARGMGARGIGRGTMGKKLGPPPNLLSVGVVAPKASAAASPASAAPVNTARPAGDDESVAVVEESLTEKPAKATRKRGAKKAAAKEPAKKKEPVIAPPPAAKRVKTARKKTAAKSGESK